MYKTDRPLTRYGLTSDAAKVRIKFELCKIIQQKNHDSHTVSAHTTSQVLIFPLYYNSIINYYSMFIAIRHYEEKI